MHAKPPMFRSIHAFALTLLASSVAVAQSSTSPPMSGMTTVGTCSGSGMSSTGASSSFTATISFAARKQVDIDSGSKTKSSIYSTYAPFVYGKAECECDPSEESQDEIFMVIQISSLLPVGANPTVTAWVGTGCDMYTTRTNTNAVSCRQFSPSNLIGTAFATGSPYTVSNPLYMWVPARLLFNPQTGSCEQNGANSIWIFIGTNQMSPDAQCSVNLSETAIGPSKAINPRASSGDSAISVSWDVPTVSNTTGFISPNYFQVLCADEDGNPIKDKPAQAYYSTCTANGIQRRQNIFGSSTVSVGATDGGVVSDGGTAKGDSGVGFAGTAPLPGEPAAATDGGTADLASLDMNTEGDMASSYMDTSVRPTHWDNIGPFSDLDQRYICAAAQTVSSTTQGVRVEGLTNGKNYQFVVLSIDQYGNATPSELLVATPQPAEDLYGALRSQGSGAHGFCFVATAAFGDYDHPQVRTLRAFRDRVLETSAAGRWFIGTYYRLSPPLAHFIEQGNGRRFVARILLWPLVAFAEVAIELHSVVLALLFVAGVVFLARRYRRHRRMIEATA